MAKQVGMGGRYPAQRGVPRVDNPEPFYLVGHRLRADVSLPHSRARQHAVELRPASFRTCDHLTSGQVRSEVLAAACVVPNSP